MELNQEARKALKELARELGKRYEELLTDASLLAALVLAL
jgi:hypothetical protein